jgi:hypothetical protein
MSDAKPQFDDTLMADGAEHRDLSRSPWAEMSASRRRSGSQVAGHVTSDGQPPGRSVIVAVRRDQQIVSFVWHHRSDLREAEQRPAAATRRRYRIITWFHNPMHCDGR